MLGTTTRDRQAERREATRREIVDAAWALARERGLIDWTLRDVADAVGMRAPSLYSHFESKNAIYDAMFGQAWGDYEQLAIAQEAHLPPEPRDAVKHMSFVFFDFSVADLARYQLMNQRTIRGFEPSAEAFAPSVRMVQRSVELLAARGVRDEGWMVIWFALLGGLIDQQLANDPGGDSRRQLLDRAVDMWADAAGMPKQDPSGQTSNRRKK
jgi:AcrR family transcriptional regulator